MRVHALVLLAMLCCPAASVAQAEDPSRRVGFRVEAIAGAGAAFLEPFTPRQRAILEKLNRADIRHLPRLRELVVPLSWPDDELAYSPFPRRLPAADAQLLIVDQPSQAFGAYERGRLVRWGPTSSGRRASPTPAGWFRLNWRSRGRHSTVDPEWFMEWYLNFDNAAGLALHTHPLPGYPASHGCVRLLERDAMWLYEWGRAGTPLVIAGRYAFGSPPPWRSADYLARGLDPYAAGWMTARP
jgi:hypothetical protein